MDAETREQLKTNELASSLVSAKEWFDKYGNWILGAIALIALSFAGYRLWSWRHEAALEKGWSELINIQTGGPGDDSGAVDQFRRIIADSSDSNLRTAARVRLANLLANRAVDAGDMKVAEEAIAEFKAIVDSPDTSNNFKAAAQFRLGSLHETRRDFAAAKTAFDAVASDARYATSPFVELARQRLASVGELAARVEFAPGGPPPPASAPVPALIPSTGPASAPVALQPVPAPAALPADSRPALQP